MRTERSFICVVVAAATLILTRTNTSSQCCDGKTAAVFIRAENVSNTAKRRRRTSDSTARDEKIASATPVSSIIEDNNSSRELNGVDHRELGGRDTAAHDEEFDFFNDFHLSFSLVPTKPPIKVPTKSPTHRPTKPPTHRPTTPPSHSNIYDDDYYIPPKQERAYDDDAYYSNEHCDTIADILCNTDGFQLLCEALDMNFLIPYLADDTITATIFAPTNEAFEQFFAEVGSSDSISPEVITDVLLFHILENTVAIPFEELECETWKRMMNGKFSYTHCRGWDKYQLGRGNADDNDNNVFNDADTTVMTLNDSPAILHGDIVTCNGIIHSINRVMLPRHA